MGQDAFALLKLPKGDAEAQELVAEDPDLRVLLPDGAIAIWMPIRFESFSPDAEDRGDWNTLVGELGNIVDRHRDPRGIFVFTDVAGPPPGPRYEDALTWARGAGYWVPRASLRPSAADPLADISDEDALELARSLLPAAAAAVRRGGALLAPSERRARATKAKRPPTPKREPKPKRPSKANRAKAKRAPRAKRPSKAKRAKPKK